MRTITPDFSYTPPLRPSFPTPVLARLRSLQAAAKDELLAISLGHGVGRPYPTGSVSEYWYVVVANGDGQTCDATVGNMTPEAHDTVEVLKDSWLSAHTPARSYLALLGKAKGKCETVHFEKFTLVIGSASDMASDMEAVDDIRVLIHAVKSLKTAQQVIAELEAYFSLMKKFSALLKVCHIELPAPESLYQAQRAA